MRSLERAIGAVVRYKAVQWAERVDGGGEGKAEAEWVSVVEEGELEKILGVARWDGEEREREVRRGLTYGLVVSGMGEGGILPVETMIVPGGGKLKLTGSLGEVCRLFFFCSDTGLGLCAGHQRKRRNSADVGEDARVRPPHHEHAHRGRAQGAGSDRYPPASACRCAEEGRAERGDCNGVCVRVVVDGGVCG